MTELSTTVAGTKPSSRTLAHITHLQIEPTTRCNFTCGFCCGRHMDQSDFTFTSFEQILDQLPALCHLELQGEGEPLLHKDFFQMASLATERRIKVSTITNGSMFSASRIREIIACGIQSIMVSIESPDEDRFQDIRGGKLDKVKRGIQDLIRYRNEVRRDENPRFPAVGFAVTVLNSTQYELSGIADLYRELEMDGGILFHALSPMAPYSEFYDRKLRDELLSPVSQALAWSRYDRLVRRSTLYHSAVKHFWDDLLASREDHLKSSQRQNQFESCPWLDNALFINRHGVATACPNVKHYERFGWGGLAPDTAESISGKQRRMAAELARGTIPLPCEDCFIADSICNRSKPVRKLDE